MMFLSYADPEAADGLLAAVRLGDERLDMAMSFVCDPDRIGALATVPGFLEQVLDLVEGGPNERARVTALAIAGCLGLDAARPAIERALVGSHFGMRVQALTAINERCPDALRPDQLLHLLRDAVDHPPPWDSLDVGWEYAEQLGAAVVRLRPEGGAAPLLRIVDHECTFEHGDRVGIDDAWALGVAAAAYPHYALPFVDRWLVSGDSRLRRAAVDALGQLENDDDARPRLLGAAADGAANVSGKAREVWLKRWGVPCPVDELAMLVCREFLPGPPSEKLRGRLPLLRGPREARRILAGVLLGEGPDPEALVLLLTLLADQTLMDLPSAGQPSGIYEWSAEIGKRFGGRGIAGMCELALRFPLGRWGGWRGAIGSYRGPVPGDDAEGALARAAAWRCFEAWTGDSEQLFDALGLLARIGPPASPEIRRRLLALAVGDDECNAPRAAEALGGAGQDAALDAEVVRAMREALAAEDLERLARFSLVGLERGLEEASELLEAAIERFGWSTGRIEEVVDTLRWLAERLRDAGRVTDAWILSALDRPDTGAFHLAAHMHFRKPLPEAVPALLRALDSTVCGGAAAGEAARTLLWTAGIAVDDPRVLAIARRAEPRTAASLLAMLVYKKAPFEPLRELVEAVLVSPDPDVTSEFAYMADSLPDRCEGELRQWLLGVMPRIVDEEIREALQEALTPEAAPWSDGELA